MAEIRTPSNERIAQPTVPSANDKVAAVTPIPATIDSDEQDASGESDVAEPIRHPYSILQPAKTDMSGNGTNPRILPEDKKTIIAIVKTVKEQIDLLDKGRFNDIYSSTHVRGAPSSDPNHPTLSQIALENLLKKFGNTAVGNRPTPKILGGRGRTVSKRKRQATFDDEEYTPSKKPTTHAKGMNVNAGLGQSGQGQNDDVETAV